MKYNTRFNPTVSGDSLHLGHLYVALVNATEAHNSGGKFIVRIDNTQDEWMYRLGKQFISIYSDRYIEQISLFMKIDRVELQSNMPFRRQIANCEQVPDWVLRPIQLYDQYPEWLADPELVMYPYTPVFTLDKVLWDYYDGINWLIRGEDLLTEYSLYTYFLDLIGLPRVKQTYLPRLKTDNGSELSPISKNFGNYKLTDQVDILGVKGVIDLLKKSCLKDSSKDFTVDNIKCAPAL